jgi:hypothetical protein
LESAGLREPIAMTANTAMMARLRSNSVTVGRPDGACRPSTCRTFVSPALANPLPGSGNIPVIDQMSEMDTVGTKKIRAG